MLKPSENPPFSWPEESSIRDFRGNWWVAHTKSRNEKALAHDLIDREISYFLPMSWRTHHTKNRKFRSLLPLFSGYLFFCGVEKDRLNVLRTNRVANILTVNNQELLLNELEQIEQAIRTGTAILPHKYIKTGQLCRVISGPLFGLCGIVVKAMNSTRLILNIDMLGQSASVEIETDLIEPVD